MRGEDRVGLVYVGDGATSHRRVSRRHQLRRGAALPAGRHRREQRLRLLDADRRSRPRREQFVDKAVGYGIPGEQADGNDVLAVYDVTRRAVDRARARRRRDAHRADDLPSQGTRGARQPALRARRRDRAVGGRERSARPLHRACCATNSASTDADIAAIDARVAQEVDAATDEAEQSAPPRAARRAHRRVRRSAGRAAALVPRGRGSRGRRARTAGRLGHVARPRGSV